jgi:mono/diheme cytochrome c family protein
MPILSTSSTRLDGSAVPFFCVGQQDPKHTAKRRVVPRGACLALAAAIAFGFAQQALAQQPAEAEPTEQRESEGPQVNFEAQVQPILATRCVQCHGPQKRSGGLRLDQRKFALEGGDTGRPILSGDLETNELYRRVSATDRSVRMPKNNDPLSSTDLETIRRWVAQGALWPDKESDSARDASWADGVLRWTDRMVLRYQYEYERAMPLAVGFILIQVVLFAIARAKAAYARQRAWTQGRARRFCKFSSEVRSRELTAAWLLSVAGVVISLLFIHQQKLNADVAQLRVARAAANSRWANSLFGSPPVPFRPDHSRQVAITYYRGNCERNKLLYNNGNYLTATFHVSLCDSKHEPIEVGDSLPDGKVFVRLEIVRAPGTTIDLFSRDLMSAVFLSKHFYETFDTELVDEPTRLETLEEDQRWVAYFPVGSPPTNENVETLEGLIYVFTGRIQNDTARGDPHYAIKYDLAFVDGKLSDNSDVWMNSFGNGAFANPEPPGKLPYREWFDYRPMPPIEGENTNDPKLLGVEEYVRKGLIKPTEPAEPPEPEN